MDQMGNVKSVIYKEEPMIATIEPPLEPVEAIVSKTTETASKTTETASKTTETASKMTETTRTDLADLMTDAEEKTKNAATLGTVIANYATDIATDAEEREHTFVDQVDSVLQKNENILEYRGREESDVDTNSLILLTCIEDNAFEAKRAAIAAEAAIEALKHSEKATGFVKTVAAFKPKGDSLIVEAARRACTKAIKASEAIAEYKIAVEKSNAAMIEAAKISHNLYINNHLSSRQSVPVRFQLNNAAKDLQGFEAAAKSAEEATLMVKREVEKIRQTRSSSTNLKESEYSKRKQEKEATKRKQDIEIQGLMMLLGLMPFAPLTARYFLIPAEKKARSTLVPAVPESSTKIKPGIPEVPRPEKSVLIDITEKSAEEAIRAAVDTARQVGTERTEQLVEAAIRAAVDTILRRAAAFEEKANYVVKQVEEATAAVADAVKAEAAADVAVKKATRAAETATAAAETAKAAAEEAEKAAEKVNIAKIATEEEKTINKT